MACFGSVPECDFPISSRARAARLSTPWRTSRCSGLSSSSSGVIVDDIELEEDEAEEGEEGIAGSSEIGIELQ
jgi:hypothetical protein